jgi:hypothetical protein
VGDVVEVGAGLGSTTRYLCDGRQRLWLCLEPDRATAELEAASKILRPNGALIVLAPAHRWLYSPFDRAIGHYRRYTRRSLAAVGPPGLRHVVLRYLDSVGLLASAGNRFILRKSIPTAGDIARWDQLMVPVSRRIDGWLGFRIGKSVLGIWRAEPPGLR